MKRYQLTPLAKQDLSDISNYIAQYNPAAARKIIRAIRPKCRFLARFPRAGRRRDDLGTSLRSSVSGKYIIVYRAAPSGVEVIRIVHGSRDIPSLFRP